MISQEQLWKKDLIKTANKLLLRMVQKKWSNSSIFNLEKELFFGFYSVRRLIECNYVSNSITNKNYKLRLFPRKILHENDIGKTVPYHIESSSEKLVSIRDICNQFIHSYHLVPLPINGTLIGFFVNSEYQSKHGIYLITIFDVAEIFRVCAGKTGLVEKKINKT